MSPVNFPESNCNFNPPGDFDEVQVQKVSGWVGQVMNPKSSVDGAQIAVVAWKPTWEELKALNNGGLVFLSVIGGLPPHFICTDFQLASNPT